MNKSIFFLMSCISIFGMQPKLHSYDNAVFGPYLKMVCIGFVSFATGVLVANYLPKIQYKSQLAQEVDRLKRNYDQSIKKVKELQDDFSEQSDVVQSLIVQLKEAQKEKSSEELRENLSNEYYEKIKALAEIKEKNQAITNLKKKCCEYVAEIKKLKEKQAAQGEDLESCGLKKESEQSSEEVRYFKNHPQPIISFGNRNSF